jgi:hypothetical protein
LLEQEATPFRSLASRFGDVRQALALHDDGKFTTPYWLEWAETLARDFAPAPPSKFLRHPLVQKTMFVAAGRKAFADQVAEVRRWHPQIHRLVREDAVGGPPLQSLRLLTSHNRVHHAYHLARFERATARDARELESVVEWGGGYGDLARVFGRLNECTYTIVDLPVISALQWLYLASALGEDRVNLVCGDAQLEAGKVNIVPVGLVERVGSCDLFISTWALSESTPDAADLVISRAWFGARHLLLGYGGTMLRDVAESAGAVIESASPIGGSEYAFR